MDDCAGGWALSRTVKAPNTAPKAPRPGPLGQSQRHWKETIWAREAGGEELGCHGNLCWHFLFGEAEAYFAGSVGFLNPISWCFFRKGKRAGEGGGKRQAGRETVRGSRQAGDGSQDSRELMGDLSLSCTHTAQFRTKGGRGVTSDPLHRLG